MRKCPGLKMQEFNSLPWAAPSNFWRVAATCQATPAAKAILATARKILGLIERLKQMTG